MRISPALRLLCLALTLLLAAPCALADEDRSAQFDAALAALKTPAQAGAEADVYTLRTGESAYVPYLDAPIVPFDERETATPPAVNGAFESSDEGVVTVSPDGLMTAVSPGEAAVTYTTGGSARTCAVTVSDDAMPEGAKNYVYVLNREFYSVKRARLPKYNKYAKWYYGKRKEVGWCSVFTIYCANAAGNEPLKRGDVDYENTPAVQFLREGQVGHQYDGFWDMGRFVDVPKPGYLVIYADMSNAYRTVHIGSVTDVRDLGDGQYAVTSVDCNMSFSVKSYCYLYVSTKANNRVGSEKGLKLQNNMAELPPQMQTDPLVQYKLHTDHWSVFGFCQTWK